MNNMNPKRRFHERGKEVTHTETHTVNCSKCGFIFAWCRCPITRVINNLRSDGHEAEANAIALVHLLMVQYAYTKEQLTPAQEELGNDLRTVVNEWMSNKRKDN